MAQSTIVQRISLDGAEQIKKQLADLGKSGEAAIKQINDAVAQSKSPFASFFSSISQLRTRFSGFAAPLQSEFRAVSAAADELGAAILRIGKPAAGVGAVLAGVGTGFLALAKSAADSVDETSDAAKNFGLTIPQLQAFKLAAAAAGESQDTLNQVLSRGSVSLGNAQQELIKTRGDLLGVGKSADILRGSTEELRGTFDKVGQSAIALRGGVQTATSALSDGATVFRGGIKPVQDTSNAYTKAGATLENSSGKFKSTFDILQEAAARLGKIEDPATKAAIASEIFGRGWARALQILDHLPDALKAVETNLPGPTEAEQQQAEAFRKSFALLEQQAKRVKDIIGGLAGTLFVPIFEQISNLLTQNSDSIRQWASGVVTTVKPVVDDIVKLLQGVGDEQIGTKGLLTARDAIIAFKDAVVGAVKLAIAAFNLLEPALNKVSSAINSVFGTNITAGGLALIVIIGQVTGVLPAMTAAFLAAAAAVRLLTVGFIAFGAAASAPVLAITALVAAAAGFVLFKDKILSALGAARDALGKFLQENVGDRINAMFAGVDLGSFRDKVTTALGDARDAIGEFLQTNVGDRINSLFSGVNFDSFRQSVISGLGVARKALDDFLTSIAGGSFWVTLQTNATIAIGSIGGLWTQLSTSLNAVIVSIEGVFSGLWGFISGGFTAAISAAEAGFNGLVDWVRGTASNILAALQPVFNFLSNLVSLAGQATTAAGAAGPGLLASGGHVRGPAGTDRVPAMLTAGEYVIRLSAVRHYGRDFFAALNSMRIPLDELRQKFDLGGLVRSMAAVQAPPLRFAAGGPVVAASGGPSGGILNLTIGKETFGGMIAPKDTFDSLARYARGSAARSTGTKPSWYGGGKL